jgi:signal transduction histidine kinase
VIQGKLEGLLDGVYPHDDSQLVEVLEEAHVLSRLVEDLRTLALSDSGALKLQKEVTDLGALARDTARTFAPDAGTGMSTEDLARAFDRFHNGPESLGSGLGLTIARSLVAAHSGDIRASSGPGRGTVVTFTLPLDLIA